MSQIIDSVSLRMNQTHPLRWRASGEKKQSVGIVFIEEARIEAGAHSNS